MRATADGQGAREQDHGRGLSPDERDVARGDVGGGRGRRRRGGGTGAVRDGDGVRGRLGASLEREGRALEDVERPRESTRAVRVPPRRRAPRDRGVRQDVEAVERRDRGGAPVPGGALARGVRRRVSPGRVPLRLRRAGVAREGVGPSHREVRAQPRRAQQAVPQRGLLPERVPRRDGQRRPHGEDLGLAEARVSVHRARAQFAHLLGEVRADAGRVLRHRVVRRRREGVERARFLEDQLPQRARGEGDVRGRRAGRGDVRDGVVRSDVEVVAAERGRRGRRRGEARGGGGKDGDVRRRARSTCSIVVVIV
mmetsp:Transcript_546/g.1725  ORF Transcript_546/g.1725 Transcript_546/m.1725 type:complete len:311 (+) Transcript_546:800-1732(+)